MDYLQGTTPPCNQSSGIPQVLPMAAPPPPSISKELSQPPPNIQLLELGNIQTSSSEQQTRSSSAPADFMLTSSSGDSSSFLGTFASASIFPVPLQQSQQQTTSYTEVRPRHHTTTNVLSLQSITSSHPSQDFIGGEVQRELNPFDGASNC